MKLKLIAASLLLSVAMSGQVKKIAILETVDKQGDLEYSVKLMLRSNLAKAITNTQGYEAYDRTDVDAIMGEQDFQRTGLVSDDQIRKLGEMTGADYILVAEAVKVDSNNMFITAKILNVESAKTEMTDNALMATSPVDIQRGCEELASSLFGVKLKSSIRASSSKSDSSEPEQESAAKEGASGSKAKDFFNNVFSSGKSGAKQEKVEPAASGTIGSLIRFEDGSAGIIFYLDPYGKGGLAVSLDEAVLQWDCSKKPADIAGVFNEEDQCSMMCNMGLGALNTDRIIAQIGHNSPAAVWCRNHGEGWYLPSGGEIFQLMNVANQHKGKGGPIDKAIQNAGGEPFQQRYYWISNECDKKEAYNFSLTGKSADTEKKNTSQGVRAVRMF